MKDSEKSNNIYDENKENATETSDVEVIISEDKIVENKYSNIISNNEVNSKKKNRLLIILIIFLSILSVSLIIYIICFNDNNKNTDANNNTNNNMSNNVNDNEKEEENNEDELNSNELVYKDNVGKYKRTIYRESLDVYSLKDRSVAGEYNIVTDIYVDSLDTEILSVAEGTGKENRYTYVLYKDSGKLKLFDIVAKKSAIINLDSNYDVYRLLYNSSNGEISAILFYLGKKEENYQIKGYDKYGIYNLASNKIMYNDTYYNLYYVDKNHIGASSLERVDESEVQHYLLSLNEEKMLLEISGSFHFSFDSLNNGNSTFILFKHDMPLYDGPHDIYTSEYKLLKENVESNMYGLSKDGMISISDGKIVTKYSDKGIKMFESKQYDKVHEIINDWYVVVEDSKLKITNGENITKELGNWNEGNAYHDILSGYYDSDYLSKPNEKEAGIYIIIGNNDSKNSGVEYYFNPVTYETREYLLETIGEYAKPVLYLYPTKPTDIDVNFKYPDNLTVTYPKFKKSWQVKAYPNGDLYDRDGNYYYGLYWEENLNHLVDFSEGFYVTKENAIKFLEEKLNIIGLNPKERNEFIMYWLPVLEKNEKSLVYFELTEEREKFNKLIINPAPDSLLRVAIHVKKVNEKVDIKEQKLLTFKREGFVAVEWGGIIY